MGMGIRFVYLVVFFRFSGFILNVGDAGLWVNIREDFFFYLIFGDFYVGFD